jgi:thiol-disulfide isomerase/thioredoxin
LLAGGAAASDSDSSLRDLDGNLRRVSDYRCRWLVINFRATWCPPCVHEMPELERFYRENRSRATVWGLTFEDTDIAKIREFADRRGVSHPILRYGQDTPAGYGGVQGSPTPY